MQLQSGECQVIRNLFLSLYSEDFSEQKIQVAASASPVLMSTAGHV